MRDTLLANLWTINYIASPTCLKLSLHGGL